MKQMEFLDKSKKLLDEVVAKLCGETRVRLVDGAHSLAHIMVVVPTAQAGRNLRLALAKEAARRGWGGILPPKVVMPFQLVVPADQSFPDANEAETAAFFTQFISDQRPDAATAWPHLFRRVEGSNDLQAIIDPDAGFALFDQMSDIWRILAGKGLLMKDVPTNEKAARVLEMALGEDKDRWEELAAFETKFFAFLNARDLRHPAASVALAKNAAAPLDPQIEEIILPALADPVLVLHDVLEQYADSVQITTFLHCAESERDRFDEWGCPKVECWTGAKRPVVDGLADGDIFSLPDDKMLAQQLVKDFPKLDSGLKLPALGLCDADLFTPLSAAFLNAGYEIQNPERNRLVVSSLGMLLRDLLALWRSTAVGVPWTNFAALMRAEDVLEALKSAGLTKSRSLVLQGLDAYQNAKLPTFVADRFELPQGELNDKVNDAAVAFVACGNGFLSWLEEARKDHSLAEYLRAMLTRIFAGKSFGASREEKEFKQAVNCVQDVLAMLSSERVNGLSLSGTHQVALARRLFERASYSLESVAEHLVRTEGWLELVWSTGDKIALAGLHEGAVPDSVVGHAFLPNELRAALGLASNETRLARDSWLLKELVDSHEPHAIRAYVSRTNGKGDICRPSRLLFLCPDDALAVRVESLFGDAGETALTPSRTVSKAWRLRLPDEVPLKKDKESGKYYLSPSAIDTYLKSPFGYLLKYGLGLGDRYEDKQELGHDDYGTFVHRVLEVFANEQKELGKSPLTTEQSILDALNRIMDAEERRFGANPTANVQLQLKSARERILRFAAVQAKWVEDGWRVEGTEIPYFVKPFEDVDVSIKGFVDRVDCRNKGGNKEFRIIDYKTWDEVGKISGQIKSSGEKEIAFADKLKLPKYIPTNKKNEPGKPLRMLTIQLPLYGECLTKQYPERFNGPITEYVYLVLAEDLIKVNPITEYADVSIKTAKVAIQRILANIFWPLRPDENGRLYDFDRLFSISPEKDLDADDDANGWCAKQKAKLEELENA